MTIGQFKFSEDNSDIKGTAICQVDESGSLKVPDGWQVEVRLVDDYDAGSFWKVLKENQDEASANPNCLSRKDAITTWIDWTALPHAFLLDPAPLSFGAEFYEIVNSKEDIRDDITAVLTCTASLTTNMKPPYFFSARRGSTHPARAIREGLRIEELLPTIMQDFRCWASVAPSTHDTSTTILSMYTIKNNSTNVFDVLPVELLLVILGHVSLSSYLSVSATCRSLRSFLIAPDFIDTIIKTAITSAGFRQLTLCLAK
ncbi:hypothetical protein PILCRDRAFT_10677 [Piloderma croceum F 1598]|uniref:F-box domain-containing protein n=1 Tax=Piloderma croceum (strain F 1598) TaxID=765440 RepID=A0A0C3F2I1_PILCF|nr:hypothetical protein PILCRDRAFT_10677 [Piloderma croceum F 1598]